MPSKQQLEAALINADKAGDVEAATMLATALKNNQYDQPTEQKSGVSQQDVAGMLNTEAQAAGQSKPLEDIGVGERAVHVIKDIPRGAGVTTRNVLEGVGSTVDFIGTPLAAGIEYVTGGNPRGMGKYVADKLGLPTPEPGLESVVSEAQKLVAGGAGLVGAFGKASQLVQSGGTAQKVFQGLSARPDLQLASAAGSGLAGGAVKESGGGPIEQAVAALAGGIAAPVALSGTQKLYNTVKSGYEAARHPEYVKKVDAIVDAALNDKGVTVQQVGTQIRGQLIQDIKAAQRRGELDPDVVRRLVDYRMTGLTPTAGPLTLDPGVITKQKNLSKLGVNSKDPALQKLSQIEYQNNAKLIENLNKLGANVPGDNTSAAEKVIDALDGVVSANKQKIDFLYDAARKQGGRGSLLDGKVFAESVKATLKEKQGGMDFLPDIFKNKIAEYAKGDFTVDEANILKTLLGKATSASTDGNARTALGTVARMIDDVPFKDLNNLPVSVNNNTRILDDIIKMVDSSKTPVFIRWSAGSKYDLAPNAVSRDYVSGGKHAGLSAVELPKGMTRAEAAKYINEYRFLKMKDPKIKPFLYEGNVLGKDSDGYISIAPKKLIGEIPDELQKNLSGDFVRRLELESSISDANNRLLKITDPIGKDIMNENLLKYKGELELINSKLQGKPTGTSARDAANAARAANREWMTKVDKIPAIKAVIDGVEPDKFMNTYIIGTGKDAGNANVLRLQQAIKESPEAMGAVRDNIAQFLKTKALGGAADEVGNFSQSGYNKAMQSIGDAKLRLFFSEQEMKLLKAIGRVASYEKFQPTGSAVNNSNTASTAIAAVLDRIAGSSLARRFVPYYSEAIANPITSARQSTTAKQLLDLPTAAKAPRNVFIPAGALLAPTVSAE